MNAGKVWDADSDVPILIPDPPLPTGWPHRLADKEETDAVRELMVETLGYPQGSGIEATPLDNLTNEVRGPLP